MILDGLAEAWAQWCITHYGHPPIPGSPLTAVPDEPAAPISPVFMSHRCMECEVGWLCQNEQDTTCWICGKPGLVGEGLRRLTNAA